MKTLTSCELLRVADGRIFTWESPSQWRSDMLHVDKAHHAAAADVNQCFFSFSCLPDRG